jgi:hypothetical protein
LSGIADEPQQMLELALSPRTIETQPMSTIIISDKNQGKLLTKDLEEASERNLLTEQPPLSNSKRLTDEMRASGAGDTLRVKFKTESVSNDSTSYQLPLSDSERLMRRVNIQSGHLDHDELQSKSRIRTGKKIAQEPLKDHKEVARGRQKDTERIPEECSDRIKFNTQSSVTENPNTKIAAREKTCNNCHKSYLQMRRCSRCSQTYYCNEQCQQSDWSQHKKGCKPKQQLKNNFFT